MIRYIIGSALLCAVLVQPAWSEHPIDIERLSARGDHFQALVAFERLPKRRRDADVLFAAAKSSWAIGLVSQARSLFDELLQNKNLIASRKAQIFLARGVIELQEGKDRVAELFAGRTLSVTPHGDMAVKAHLLAGDALRRLGEYGAAEDHYTRALEGADPSQAIEAHFRLGEVTKKLGDFKEARLHFEQVPLGHERTPEAIRALADLALRTGEFQHASFWLARGRQDYPDEFLDSEVDYRLEQAAAAQGDIKGLTTVWQAVTERYPESDSWASLAGSLYEITLWRTIQEGPK